MGKEKSEKSTTSDVSFPAGEWSVFIQNGNGSVNIGSLDLAEVPQSPEQYDGTIDFGDNPDFGPIRNGGFSVEIVTFDPETGVIYFKIPEAAEEYNPNTSPPYQFVFMGWYCEPSELCGIARVPKGFGQGQGKPGEDGDDVTWIAKGITDPPHKPSR
jgi:hypothetical protein